MKLSMHEKQKSNMNKTVVLTNSWAKVSGPTLYSKLTPHQ